MRPGTEYEGSEHMGQPVTDAGRRLLESWGGNPEGATGRAILAIEDQAWRKGRADTLQAYGIEDPEALRVEVPDGPPGEIAEVYGK